MITLIKKNEKLYVTDSCDPVKESFNWMNTSKEPSENFIPVFTQETQHTYGSSSIFKPTENECVSQCSYKNIEEITAISCEYLRFNQGYTHHIGLTTYYKNSNTAKTICNNFKILILPKLKNI